MTDLTPGDLGYGQEDDEAYLERPEASESGIITELEHRRSRSMSNDDPEHDFIEGPSEEDGGANKKGKSRRLSTRVARKVKKQFKSGDKSRPRSLSPPRSQRSLTSSEGDQVSPGDNQTGTVVNLEPKKKHKSKFKPVAKAAAAAAKKLAGKSSSSSKHKHEEEASPNSSRASTPTNLQGTSQTTASSNLMIGKTPMNTPVNASSIVDRATIDSVIQQLPATLAECAEDEEREQGEDEKSMTEEPAKFAPSTKDPPALDSEPAPAAVPTEDEALKLAEAMAMAVQSNPTKSQEEIRRMVYSQPEFKHLAPPETVKPSASSQGSGSSGSDSTTKLLKKNFSSIKKQFTSGAGTAQKKILGLAETNLSASISSFSFGIGGSSSSTSSKSLSSSTAKAPSAADVEAIEKTASAKEEGSASANAAASSAPVATIPEDSQLTLEPAQTTGSSLMNSIRSMSTQEDSVTEEEKAKAAPAQSDPVAAAAPPAVSGSGHKKWRDLPIKITDIVWKRRSGFGKYSTDAWERRRFVLQGNVLSYYRAKRDSLEPMEDESERTDLNAPVSNIEKPSGGSSKSSTKQRMFDYMEQVAVSAGLAATAEKSDEEKNLSARGYMDLIKENAVICATLGHSGAPSPFCLSIKVSGETKWKLCFSSHRSQLQWMAAISDVIVQASVDIYNVKLLTKADPANHDPTQAFQPTVYEPPAGGNDQQPSSEKSIQSQQKRETEGDEDDLLPQPSMQVSGNRLWIMEPYVIRPEELGADYDEEGSFCSSSSADEDDDPATAGGTELLDDRDSWSLPEKNLLFATVIINVAILYARNSTMSVQSFWTVVTVANMGLFAFLESKPRLEAATATSSKSSPRKSRSKRRRSKKGGAAAGGAGSGDVKGDGTAGRKAKKEAFKPMAGMSAIRVEKPDDSNENAKGEKLSRWCAVDGETVQVRSHGYMTTKAKIPSPGSLYDLAQVDIFESPSRYPDMAPRVKLPKLSYDVDPNEVKTWKAPDHFVISLSLPTDPPKLGASSSDGGGYTVTMYYTMRKLTRDILKRVTADGYDPSSEETPEDMQKSTVNAVRLFEEWCRRGPNDVKFLTRFKMVPHAVNAAEVGMPSWIGKYNGKPLLIKRPGQTGFLLPHPELSCIEFDISLHVFPYLAKQGICYLKDTMFKKILATVGFVIEGRDDDELPECLIGLAQICYPDPDTVMPASDYFAGTGPRSFEADDVKPAPAPAAEETVQSVG